MGKTFFTQFPNVKTANGTVLEEDIAQFLSSKTVISREKDGICFSMARYAFNHRCNKGLLGSTGVSLDFDQAEICMLNQVETKLTEMNIYCLIYSSYSHGLSETTSNFRVVVPFDKEVDQIVFSDIWKTLTTIFEFKNDIACKDAARVMYVPTIHPDRTESAFFKIIEGSYLSPDDFLKDHKKHTLNFSKNLNKLKKNPSKVGRNTWLTSQAGKLLSKGVTGDELKEKIIKLNTESFSPALPNEEVENILKSVSKYTNDQSGPASTNSKKEAINPSMVYCSLRQKYNFIYLNGDYYVYLPRMNQWKKVDREYFESIISRQVIEEGMDFYSSTIVGNIRQAVKVFATIQPQNIPFWIKEDPQQSVIKTKNGIILSKQLMEGKDFFIEGETPHYFDTGFRDINYDPDAKCPTWDKFLKEMLTEDQETLLQDFLGYCLIPDTSFAKMLFLIGEGANGKSVICLIIRLLLGESYCSFIPLEAMDVNRTYNLSSMIGSLVNICEEIGEIDKAAEGLLKNLVTGGRITVEKKFKDPIDVTFRTRLIFATNNFPRFRDKSNGMWRRIIPIFFHKQILDESKQDKNLVSPEWWVKSGEMPGVLNWAIEGLVNLQKRGKFIESPEVSEYLKQLKHKGNPTLEFIEDHLTFKLCSEVSSTELYTKYSMWATDNGYSRVAANTFAEQVKHFFQDQVSITKNAKPNSYGKRVRHWINLELKREYDVSASRYQRSEESNDTDNTEYLI